MNGINISIEVLLFASFFVVIFIYRMRKHFKNFQVKVTESDTENDSLERQLQQAIEDQNTALALKLIHEGADITKEIGGENTLGWATTWGNIELVKILVGKGVSLTQENNKRNLIDIAKFGQGEADEANEKESYSKLILYFENQGL